MFLRNYVFKRKVKKRLKMLEFYLEKTTDALSRQQRMILGAYLRLKSKDEMLRRSLNECQLSLVMDGKAIIEILDRLHALDGKGSPKPPEEEETAPKQDNDLHMEM